MTFPNLKAEMARRCVSVDEVAKTSGVSPKTVYNWLNGSTDITFSKCLAIRDKHFPTLDIDYLFSSEPSDK